MYLEPGSPLIGRPLRFLQEHYQLCVLSHRRQNQEANLFPAGDEILCEQDRIIILGQTVVISRLLQGDHDRRST